MNGRKRAFVLLATVSACREVTTPAVRAPADDVTARDGDAVETSGTSIEGRDGVGDPAEVASEPEESPSSAKSGYGRGWSSGLGGRGMTVPRLRVSKPVVRGALDRDLVRRVVRMHINEIRYCYAWRLAEDPMLTGTVVVHFTIGADERVSAVDLSGSTVSDETVARCIARSVKRWTFPASADGDEVSVTYELLGPG